MTRSAQRGFTLMELMITVAIVAILASIALASYRSQIVRSNRTAAEGFMQELASREERYLLDSRTYAIGASALTMLNMTVPTEVSRNYTISIGDDADPNTTLAYEIKASPTGAQSTDDTACGNLTLNSLGQKSADGTSTARCWQ